MKNFVSYNLLKSTQILTHSSDFHSDELFTIALLARYHFKCSVQDLNICRTRNNQLIEKAQKTENVFVVDVGRIFNPEQLSFDHHQTDPELIWDKTDDELENLNKPKKSSCGLIYDFLKSRGSLSVELESEDMAVLERLVRDIDASDNGEKVWKDNLFFKDFNRECLAIENQQFEKALLAAESYLDNYIYKALKKKIDKEIIKKAVLESERNQHEDYLILNESVSSPELLNKLSSALFYVTVYNDAQFVIKTICSEVDNPYSRRMSLPSEWGGLEGKELEEVSGIKGMKFCHKALFITVFDGNRQTLKRVMDKILKGQ